MKSVSPPRLGSLFLSICTDVHFLGGYGHHLYIQYINGLRDTHVSENEALTGF